MKYLIILVFGVVGVLAATACGSATPGAEAADDGQASEMTDEQGDGSEQDDDGGEVTPADHDIEVPPAP